MSSSNEAIEKIIKFAKYYGDIFEDLSEGVLGFIFNGLEQIYDKGLKRIPYIRKIFQHRWVEQVVKLCTGITIGQGLAADLSRFVFWPIGCGVGAIISLFWKKSFSTVKAPLRIKMFLYKLSGMTIPSALIGGVIGALYYNIVNASSVWMVLGIGCGIGAMMGVMFYGMYLAALTWVKSEQVQGFYQQANTAKKLGIQLKDSARQLAKGRIIVYAQDIIQQMNGSFIQTDLTEFFESDLDAIAQVTNKKIDRHILYLIEKATHGDEQALYRLQVLVNKKTDLNKLLDRVFNARAIAKIKDEVDTRFDRWHYRFLKA